MFSIWPPLPRIKTAIRAVYRVLEQRDSHTPLRTAMSEDYLWRELVACILSSRVRFDVAHAAIERMDRANLFSSGSRSSAHDEYEQDIFCALSGVTQQYENSSSQRCYPFPKLRANQIRMAAQKLYSNYRSILDLLNDARDPRVARRRLAAEVHGLGPKQASLFLRNIGYAEDIAVLDIHLLTYMNWIGLIPAPMKSVRTIQKYETLENMFIEHSCANGFRVNLFDVAVWVVIRTVRKECRVWR